NRAFLVIGVGWQWDLWLPKIESVLKCGRNGLSTLLIRGGGELVAVVIAGELKACLSSVTADRVGKNVLASSSEIPGAIGEDRSGNGARNKDCSITDF